MYIASRPHSVTNSVDVLRDTPIIFASAGAK
jgi:hypothetical protein